jgi:hypothetical protein
MSSAKHVSDVVSKFDETKKKIVRCIGFGSILDLPYFPHSHCRFYFWLLSKVKWYPKTISLDDRFRLKITDEHMGKIIGLSYTGQDVRRKTFENDNEKTTFIKSRLAFLGTDSDILSAAELYVISDFHEDMNSQQRDNFKIAFVIFVMGRFLAPTSELSCGHSDFWGALENPGEIASFNWSSYILFRIMEAARAKLWSSLESNTVTHITGCSLILQVLKYMRFFLVYFNYAFINVHTPHIY